MVKGVVKQALFIQMAGEGMQTLQEVALSAPERVWAWKRLKDFGERSIPEEEPPKDLEQCFSNLDV